MITEQEWREWKSLRSLAYPGPETLHTVYRVAYPALLDEVERLRAKVTALEGGIVAENRRTSLIEQALQAVRDLLISHDEDFHPKGEVTVTEVVVRILEERKLLADQLYNSEQAELGLNARVSQLKAWFAAQPYRVDDDPSLTCVLCNGTGCEFTIETTNGGAKYWHGIHKACREQARDQKQILIVTRTVLIKTWQTERGWSASEDGQQFFRIEAEGGETAREATDNVIGAIMIALGNREHPPYSVRFVVRREEEKLT